MTYRQYPPQGGHPHPGMAPKPSGATGIIAGILLVMRKGAGRVLTVAGAASTIFISLVSVILRLAETDFFYPFGGVAFLYGFIGIIVHILLPAITTMVLALIPPTARWVAKKPAVLMPPQNFGYPPGQPPSGYPQAPGPPPARW